jgi:hypothetical protein
MQARISPDEWGPHFDSCLDCEARDSLEWDHKALARVLFAPMSRRELDAFAAGLAALSLG